MGYLHSSHIYFTNEVAEEGVSHVFPYKTIPVAVSPTSCFPHLKPRRTYHKVISFLRALPDQESEQPRKLQNNEEIGDGKPGVLTIFGSESQVRV